jgi:hypothetical protein
MIDRSKDIFTVTTAEPIIQHLADSALGLFHFFIHGIVVGQPEFESKVAIPRCHSV